jgi:hypothetical protein
MEQPEVSPADDRHAAVIAIVERSALARGGRRAMAFLGRAWRSSHAARTAGGMLGAWRSLPDSTRRTAIGVAIVTAVATHVAVTATHRIPPGWQWLVVPGIALAQGVVLIAAGRRAAGHS